MASNGRVRLQDRLSGPGPKRILAIDACGARIPFATAALSTLEQALKRRSGQRDFKLADYFDLIGGASLGALIAASLAMGRSAQQAGQLAREIAPNLANADRFDAGRLDVALQREFGAHELPSTALQTGLAVFVAPVDAPLRAYANAPHHGAERILLRGLIAASIGAPNATDAAQTAIGAEDQQLQSFLDAGAAGLPNPSLELFKLATLPSHGFNWGSGDDRLLMASIGAAVVAPHSAAARAWDEASLSAVTTLQAVAETPAPWPPGAVRERVSPLPLLHFARIDGEVDGDSAALRDRGLGDPGALAALDAAGRAAGEAALAGEQLALLFPARFDPPSFALRPQGPPRSQLEAMSRLFGGRDS